MFISHHVSLFTWLETAICPYTVTFPCMTSDTVTAPRYGSLFLTYWPESQKYWRSVLMNWQCYASRCRYFTNISVSSLSPPAAASWMQSGTFLQQTWPRYQVQERLHKFDSATAKTLFSSDANTQLSVAVKAAVTVHSNVGWWLGLSNHLYLATA